MNRVLKITRVLTLPCQSLANFSRLSDLKVSCTIQEEAVISCSIGRATLDITTDKIDGDTAYKATLVMNWCPDELPKRRMAYLCELTDGSHLLLGTPNSPYPVAEAGEKHTRLGDRQTPTREVTVTWTDRFPPSEIV